MLVTPLLFLKAFLYQAVAPEQPEQPQQPVEQPKAKVKLEPHRGSVSIRQVSKPIDFNAVAVAHNSIIIQS